MYKKIIVNIHIYIVIQKNKNKKINKNNKEFPIIDKFIHL